MLAALRRMVISEVYARIVVAVILATIGSLGLLVSWNSAAVVILGIGAMVVIYRVRYGRW